MPGRVDGGGWGSSNWMPMHDLAAQDKRNWILFLSWALLGIAWGFTFVGMASIGLLILPLALAGTAGQAGASAYSWIMDALHRGKAWP